MLSQQISDSNIVLGDISDHSPLYNVSNLNEHPEHGNLSVCISKIISYDNCKVKSKEELSTLSRSDFVCNGRCLWDV